MCAIAGLLRIGEGPPPERTELEAMVQAQAHRGPDGHRLWFGGPVGLAHARLALVDPLGGAQPLSNEDGRIRVVCNGEIFNHRSLRRELEARGHRFASGSDCEVIAHLYEEHGEACVEHLNGQFAFALWDAGRRRLLLARDRVGIRPLHWTIDRGRLAFASEIKGLAALGVSLHFSALGLGQVFSQWSPRAPDTVFESIWQLPPAHLMVIEADGSQRERRYWDWSFEPLRGAVPSLEDCVEELDARLLESVRLQSEVPGGADGGPGMLAVSVSGGLDSSLIEALARHDESRGAAHAPVHAFSLRFDEAEYDEGEAQDLLRSRLGGAQTRLRVDEAAIAAHFEQAVWHAEIPLLRTAPVPMYLLARAMRGAGARVFLSGEGADEVFAGYDLFKEARIRRWLAAAPDSRRRAGMLQKLYPYLASSPVASGGFAHRFFATGLDGVADPLFAHQLRVRTTSRALRFLSPDWQARIAGADAEGRLRASLPAGLAAWSALGRDQYVEATTLLPGYLLAAQGDRMAMAYGVEARHPFLDHRLIEWAGRLPPAYKLRALHEKLILKRAARDRLPAPLVARPKQPYRAPDVSPFVRAGRLLEQAAVHLEPARIAAVGLFEPRAVAALVGKCCAGQAIGHGDRMAFLGILSTMILHTRFVETGPERALRAGSGSGPGIRSAVGDVGDVAGATPTSVVPG